MDIIFMGTPDFAVSSLEKLAHSQYNIKAVVTGIDKRRGRGSRLSPTPVKAKALELDLPIIEVENLQSESFVNRLKELEADLFVVVAFRILPVSVLAIPALGSVNLHASLLPKYRGAAPIHWAVMNGETQTGCTVFQLDEKVDTGAIIGQSTTEIGPNETTGDLYNRLKEQGAELLVHSLKQIEQEEVTATQQDDEVATSAPKLFTEDCKINFNQPAEDVHNKIRGLSPFPTAWATLDGAKFNMYRSAVVAKDLKVGHIAHANSNMIVGCRRGAVALKKVKLEGKRKMDGNDFMNGYHGSGILK